MLNSKLERYDAVLLQGEKLLHLFDLECDVTLCGLSADYAIAGCSANIADERYICNACLSKIS